MKSKAVLLSVVSLLFALQFPTAAETVQAQNHPEPSRISGSGRPGESWPWAESLQKRISADWVPSSLPKGSDEKVRVTFFVADDGRIYNPEIVISSNSPQLDLDCLQAVLGAASYSKRSDAGTGWLKQTEFTFDKTTPPGYHNDAIAKFFQLHPELAQSYVAFFRIPVDVLKRYPGVFTEEEIFSPENIGVFPRDREGGRFALRLTASIYSDWTSFYLAHPAATKEQIIAVANEIPNRYPR